MIPYPNISDNENVLTLLFDLQFFSLQHHNIFCYVKLTNSSGG